MIVKTANCAVNYFNAIWENVLSGKFLCFISVDSYSLDLFCCLLLAVLYNLCVWMR